MMTVIEREKKLPFHSSLHPTHPTFFSFSLHIIVIFSKSREDNYLYILLLLYKTTKQKPLKMFFSFLLKNLHDTRYLKKYKKGGGEGDSKIRGCKYSRKSTCTGTQFAHIS